MGFILAATALLSTAGVAADSNSQLVSRVVDDNGFVALIVGEAGAAPLLSASYRCIPRTNQYYAREYDDDREGMAGEGGDQQWTSRLHAGNV